MDSIKFLRQSLQHFAWREVEDNNDIQVRTVNHLVRTAAAAATTTSGGKVVGEEITDRLHMVRF